MNQNITIFFKLLIKIIYLLLNKNKFKKDIFYFFLVNLLQQLFFSIFQLLIYSYFFIIIFSIIFFPFSTVFCSELEPIQKLIKIDHGNINKQKIEFLNLPNELRLKIFNYYWNYFDLRDINPHLAYHINTNNCYNFYHNPVLFSQQNGNSGAYIGFFHDCTLKDLNYWYKLTYHDFLLPKDNNDAENRMNDLCIKILESYTHVIKTYKTTPYHDGNKLFILQFIDFYKNNSLHLNGVEKLNYLLTPISKNENLGFFKDCLNLYQKCLNILLPNSDPILKKKQLLNFKNLLLGDQLNIKYSPIFKNSFDTFFNPQIFFKSQIYKTTIFEILNKKYEMSINSEGDIILNKNISNFENFIKFENFMKEHLQQNRNLFDINKYLLNIKELETDRPADLFILKSLLDYNPDGFINIDNASMNFQYLDSNIQKKLLRTLKENNFIFIN